MNRFSLTVFALAAAAFLPLHAQERAPRIVFDSQTKDFGKVIEGQPLKHVFRFTNKGNATLQILNVAPS